MVFMNLIIVLLSVFIIESMFVCEGEVDGSFMVVV